MAEAPAASTSTAPAAPVPPVVPGAEVPTILSTLHTLLRAHIASHPSPTLPYLHPFAPLPQAKGWKGKARAGGGDADEQVATLKSMREAMETAKNILARNPSGQVGTPMASVSPGDKERIRVARAMREVITHEMVLQPLGTVLAGLPSATRSVGPICGLPPAELISALGKRLGLQVFTEDSQFGLLRTSLTLAGSRFVVDVDLEADASGDKTEPPTAAASPAGLSFSIGMGSLSQLAAPTPKDPAPLAERGKVRLAKISANHVTPAGEAGKSDWVEKVLRIALEAHLEQWNSQDKDRAELEASARALETSLAELKALDELAEAASTNDADLFADLETLAAGVQRICADGEGEDDSKWKFYADARSTMFPSFRLFDAPASVRNPAFRLRPVSKGEDVPPPTEGDAMAVDSDSTVQPMCRGKWLLEFVDDVTVPSAAGRGLVVRRTWLTPGEEEGEASAWSPSIKVEGLLHQVALEADGTMAAPLFPLASEYVHASSDTSPVQHWKLSGPGPEGYVVGRVGLPASWAAFGRLVRALRDQLVLDALFMSAFAPSAQSQPGSGDGDGDDDNDVDVDMDALAELERAPTDIPITATLYQRSMRVALSRDDSTSILEITPSATPPYVAVTLASSTASDDATATTAVSADKAAAVSGSVGAGEGAPDAVDIVRRALAVL